MTQTSRLLTIDASILRSAGGREKGHSAHCSKILQTILEDTPHQAIFCKTTSQEWTKHQSAFARMWRSSMVARKKLIAVNTQATQQKLQTDIDALTNLSANNKKALEKDIHMLALAMDADKVIITGDKILQQLTQENAIKPALEWLIAAPNDLDTERESVIQRLYELAHSKPYPPIPQ
jgi:hypothetical protein